MPCNETAFRVLQNSLPGVSAPKGFDGWHRIQYKSADVAMVMQGMEIKDGKVFQAVVDCLSGIELEHV